MYWSTTGISPELIDSVCEVGPQARPWLNRAWARPASHTVDVVTVTLPVATVTVAGATTNRVLCPTLAAEEAKVLLVGATVRADEAKVQVS
jgi:hypothetical protein